MTDLRFEAAAQRRNMRRPTSVWVFLFTLSLAGAMAAARPLAAGPGPDSSAGTTVVQSYEVPLTQYRAFRRMHAKSDKFNHEGWLEAWTELDEHGFRYQVVSERGSEYVRNKVLRTVLKREQELVADGGEKAALTDANYEFTETEPRGDVRYILMKPRRRDVVLVDGRMVLSPDGSEIVRIEGRLARNPSFWTNLVNIIRHFAKVDGVRVPVFTETIAKVKFVGHSKMDVSYEYESINSRPVSVAGRQILASAGSPATR
jgi:hypothetical protein